MLISNLMKCAEAGSGDLRGDSLSREDLIGDVLGVAVRIVRILWSDWVEEGPPIEDLAGATVGVRRRIVAGDVVESVGVVVAAAKRRSLVRWVLRTFLRAPFEGATNCLRCRSKMAMMMMATM